MKEFRKHWNREIRPYIHNPDDRELAEYWWKAALEQVLAKINTYESDSLNIEVVHDFIREELEQ